MRNLCYIVLHETRDQLCIASLALESSRLSSSFAYLAFHDSKPSKSFKVLESLLFFTCCGNFSHLHWWTTTDEFQLWSDKLDNLRRQKQQKTATSHEYKKHHSIKQKPKKTNLRIAFARFEDALPLRLNFFGGGYGGSLRRCQSCCQRVICLKCTKIWATFEPWSSSSSS